MFNLEGNVALVTGASGGLGGAIAKALCEAGAKVALTGTRKSALDALTTDLGITARPFVCDLSSGEGAERLVEKVEEGFGPVDILVNNAGIVRDGLAIRMKDEDWASVIEVNLTAAFRLSRSALRGMLRRRKGRIVNVTSVSGITGNPGQANYAASKAGMIGMSKALALEVATRGVTVNCVAPGFIETAMTESIGEIARTELKKRIPVGRFGQPEEIAAAVLYLASPGASYVTGHTLVVSGGLV